jgi:dipeptidase D
VEGLLGGHSGLNIHEDRGNAVLLMAGVVEALLKRIPGTRLVQLEGGEKRNSIARAAAAYLLVCPSHSCSNNRNAALITQGINLYTHIVILHSST